MICPTGQVVHLCMVACYTLNGNVNSYSNKYWYSENPHTVQYVPMNDLQVRVWCAMSVHKIKVPMFTKRTITSYIWLILTKLLTELPEERMHSYFMHKNMTAHSINSQQLSWKRYFANT